MAIFSSPFRARWMAMARPMPRDPPVTIAVLSASDQGCSGEDVDIVAKSGY